MRIPSRPTRSELRAALWALRSVRRARRQLRASGYSNLVLPRLPDLPEGASRGVHVVLRRLPATCLERAVVLQRWQASRGDRRDVVVGVRGARGTFAAHAWLDGERVAEDVADYRELVRLSP